MKICVMGLGYIGLPTSAMFAKHGAEVVGVDLRPDVISKLNSGKAHIEEPGLDEIVKETVDKGSLRASLTPEMADVFIIAVPTPNNEDQYKSCDLTYVLNAIKQVLPFIKQGNVIIIESTIAPRSMDNYVKPLVEEAGFSTGEDIYLVHCPERVLPGSILKELIYNNRIIGGVTPNCAKEGASVYKIFVQGEIITTDARTAEMSKLMENTFRDVNIALSNELAKVCNSLEINVLDVIEMANKHPRVNLHQTGPGVGGHCLAVDPYFIVAQEPGLTNIIQTSRNTNNSMPSYVVDSVRKILKNNIHSKIAVFGVAYKGNVDDMRESPALEVIDLLRDTGFDVAIYDPHINNEFFNVFTIEEAVIDADLLLILTDHREFIELDYDYLAKMMKNPVLFDTRNCIQEGEYSDMKIVNFGNLYKAVRRNVSAI
ncbi:nucleotide sugar dehydrogenase [Bacillus cereus]|uniref:nucleotide sugar dehydrogenase n=1 Tax=Bacillus cereus TaxID=1396 RepID=UPI0036700BEC